MMKARFILISFLFLICLSVFVNAQENCDYYDYEKYTVEETRFYLDGELLDGRIGIDDKIFGSGTVDFKVYNPFDFPVSVTVDYDLASSWFGTQHHTASGTIQPDEIQLLRGSYSTDRRTFTNVVFGIASPEGLEGRVERVTKQNRTCKNCASDEIFCSSKERCVKTSVVPLDVAPSCGLREECEYKFIDLATGLCAKSPSQLEVVLEDQSDTFLIPYMYTLLMAQKKEIEKRGKL